MQLMLDGLRPHSGEPQQWRALNPTVMAQALVAQAEPGQRIDLAGKKPIAGKAKLDEVVEHGLGKFSRFVVFFQPAIDQQPVFLADAGYRQCPAFVVGNHVARTEANSS